MRALIAHVTIKPGKQVEFRERLSTRAKRFLNNEAGYLHFDVVEDPEEPTHFAMIEFYRDDEAVKVHRENAKSIHSQSRSTGCLLLPLRLRSRSTRDRAATRSRSSTSRRRVA
jgi:quinol monooxygenase YgiN